ncbi:MAG: hypothetical protein B6D36_03490 [Planctomycetes bacterium UTPLA1]|nr:MAG: hypothetical protein B6D36_03490 [Planctomycetes bacterium UTPLA1]
MTRCCSIEELERAQTDDRLHASLQAHFLACAKCRARFRDIEKNNGFLKSIKTADPAGLVAASRADPGSLPQVKGFEFIRELHRGGQGVVYLARQSGAKRLVAIKMMLSAALATSRQRRRFEREIEIVAGLRHPLIVTVFESGKTPDGWHWFAMEHVEGVPLNVYLSQRRPTQDGLLRLMADVCDAVNFAHQRGIIHRDLKPANILVDFDGRPHILDFGLAKVFGSHPQAIDSATTQAGEFMGTFAYAAPEQFRGATADIDTRTDVYALGILLYEATTREHPFPASSSLPDFIKSVEEREPKRPSLISPDVSSELEAVILRALATEPERRYQSAGALGDDITRCLTGEPVEARRDSRWYLLRKTVHRHRLAAVVLSAFAILVLGFAIVSARQTRLIAIERDRAVSAEHTISQSAESLAAALRESNIERGRLLAQSGNVPLAESMLHREWLSSPFRREPRTVWPPDDAAYWALWELYAASPCRETIPCAKGGNPRLAFNSTGEIAAVAVGRNIHLFQWPGMKPLKVIGPTSDNILAVSFVGLTNRIVVGSVQGRVETWDFSTGEMTNDFQHGDRAIRTICPTPDGQLYFINTMEQAVCAFDPQGRRIAPPCLESDGIRSMDMDPSAQHIALGGSNDTVIIVELNNRQNTLALPAPMGPRKDVTAVRFHPDGQLLALGREEGSAEVWNWRDRNLLWSERLHHAPIVSLAFSADGATLASGSNDRLIQLTDTETGSATRTLGGHTNTPSFIYFAKKGDKLVSAGLDGLLKIWDAADHPGTRVLEVNGRTLFGLAYSADGERLAVTAAGGPDPIRVFDTRTWQRIQAFSGHRGVVTSAAFSPDGELLATGGYDHDVRLWSIADGVCRAVLKGHDNFVESVAFCMGGSRVVSAADDATLRIWDSVSHECVAVLRGHSGRCPMLSVSPDGRTIASCGIDGTVRLWSAVDGAPLAVFKGHKVPVRAVCYSADGRLVLSGGDDATIRIWDVAKKICVGAMTGSDQDIFGLTVSPDGRFAASATRGGVVQLWSLEKQTALAVVEKVSSQMFCARFGPDGRTIAVCGEAGVVKLIDLTYFDEHISAAERVDWATESRDTLEAP